jgi:16S rRNA (uracil1498-N3)-methyltransferase
MHRLLVETALLGEASPALPAEAARHLRVLRPEEGEAFELFDGRGRRRRYAFAGGALAASAPVEEVARPSGPPLVLFACVTKGSRWDWTVEKATELGVARVVPVVSARTIVRIPAEARAAKRERWTRVAEDAARQSDAMWIPEIDGPVGFSEALALARETVCFAGALTDPPSPPLLAAVRARLGASGGRPVSVFVGPEGDFTPDELAALLSFAAPASFGPTVLRAETAAVFAVSVLAAALRS